jgi:hypothetical protein
MRRRVTDLVQILMIVDYGGVMDCGVDPEDWYSVSFTVRNSDRHMVVENGSMHGGVINNLFSDSIP